MPTYKFKSRKTARGQSPARTNLNKKNKEKQRRGRPTGTTYTAEQEATAKRCHEQGMSKAETAAVANLTEQQVHYLWYVKERQENKVAARQAEIEPLASIVPDPIRRDHHRTLPDHKYKGQPTSIRTDVIEQVRRCKGKRHSVEATADHFNMKPSTVRYIWYQLGKTSKRGNR